MTIDRLSTGVGIGSRVFGLGAMALGIVGLVWGDFALQWQPVPDGIPGRTALAYLFAAALTIAGAALAFSRTTRALPGAAPAVSGSTPPTSGATPPLSGSTPLPSATAPVASNADLNWRHPAALGAGALFCLYLLVVVLLHGPVVAAHPTIFASWSGVAEQLALASASLVAYGSIVSASRSSVIAMDTRRARHVRNDRTVFAVCLLVFGAAHFLYLNFTAAMVPGWIPPGPMFWAGATGVAHIAAGIAILSGVQARLAAVLLTVMFAGFGVLIHAPLLIADPTSHLNWVINAMNLSLTGAAWVVADSLRPELSTH